MKTDAFERHITIRGRVVLEDGIDSDYIGILTDKHFYSVQKDYVGEQLLDFIDQHIEAAGFLTKYGDGSLQIELDDFNVLD